MPPNLQNSNEINSSPYSSGVYKNTNRKKPLLIIIILIVSLIVFAVYLLLSSSEQDKNTKAAEDAARKVTPNAEVRNVKVADGFAIAIVSDPTADGQAKAGTTTIFKVNQDGSMTQIASSSDFSPIDLLGLGMPLATQAKLAGRNLTQAQQDLAGMCGYSGGNVPGYFGFNGSFNPDGWQISATSLDGIEQALTAEISNKNAQAKDGEKVICVNVTKDKSNATTDLKKYTSTFTLELQLIAGNGTVSAHTFTYALGPNHFTSYTLDGQKIQPR